MSDRQSLLVQMPGESADGVAASSGPSAGGMLKAAREAQGLHIAALAVSLKVPVKKIELLEADRFDELPDAVFARGLAASVCRALKIDSTDILRNLPQTLTPNLRHSAQSINTPFRIPAHGPSPINLKGLIKRPIVWAVVGLLLAAAVLILVPDVVQKTSHMGAQALSGLQSIGSQASSEPAAIATDVSNGTVMGAGAAVSTTVEGATPAVQVTAAISPAGLGGKTSVAVSTPTLVSPTLIISPVLGSADANDAIVQFKATGESWIEVSDARGKTTLKRVLQAGESAGATGALPLYVTVGSADKTQVLVRGKPLDGGKVRNNVLRFEVR